MKIRFVKPEHSNPERDRGIQVPYAPGKRNQARWRWYAILLVVSSPFLFFAGHFLYSSVVVQAPGFVAQEQMTVRASSQGYVDEVYVHALDQVKEGDPVVKLANEAMTAHMAQLQAEMAELQKVAKSAGSGGGMSAAPLASADFQGELETARQQKDRLSARVEQIQQLESQGAATEAEVNAARGQYEQASSKMDELYRTMALQTQPTMHGANTGMMVQTQTRILAIQTELANLQQQQEAMLVRAPKGGRIVDLAVVKGDQMAIGTKVAMLAPDGGEMHIDAYIPPKNGIYAAPGMHASVVFPDGSRRDAVVSDVPQIATEVPKAQSALLGEAEMGVLVRMQLLDRSEVAQRPLTDGLPVKVEFEHRWDSPGATQFATQVQHYWDDLRDHLTSRRA
jgi:multidrug resistance efflux pump